MTWEKVGSWNSSSFVNVEVGINYPTKYQSRIIWSQLRLNQTYCQLSSNKTLHPPPTPNGFPSILPSITHPPPLYLPKLLSTLFKQLPHKSTFLTFNLLSLIPNPLSRLSILLPTYSPLFPTHSHVYLLPAYSPSTNLTSNSLPVYLSYFQPNPLIPNPLPHLSTFNLLPIYQPSFQPPTPSTYLTSNLLPLIPNPLPRLSTFNQLPHLPTLIPTHSPIYLPYFQPTPPPTYLTSNPLPRLPTLLPTHSTIYLIYFQPTPPSTNLTSNPLHHLPTLPTLSPIYLPYF